MSLDAGIERRKQSYFRLTRRPCWPQAWATTRTICHRSSISFHCSVNVMTYVGNRYQHARGQSESVAFFHQPSSNAGSSWELVHCPLPKQRLRGLWGQSVHQCGWAITLELSPEWLGIINYGYLSLVYGHELRLYVLFCSVVLNPWHFFPKNIPQRINNKGSFCRLKCQPIKQ